MAKKSSKKTSSAPKAPATKKTKPAAAAKPAKAPKAAAPVVAAPVAPAPTKDEIMARAHANWIARGKPVGSPLEDWLAAERELGIGKS